MRKTIFWAVALLVLGSVNFMIWKKEQLLRSGESIFLQLGPRDPRSLIQGDYMVLRYRVSIDAGRHFYRYGRYGKKKNFVMPPRRGLLVVKLDARQVASFIRLHKPNRPLAKGERLLEYHYNKGNVLIGAEAFHFQEGFAKCFQVARFGHLKVTKAGKSVLAGLYNTKLRKINPRDPSCKQRKTQQKVAGVNPNTSPGDPMLRKPPPHAGISLHRTAHQQLAEIARGAVTWFNAEHADNNGDPLAKHFPGLGLKGKTIVFGTATTPKAPLPPCKDRRPTPYPADKNWDQSPWNNAPWRSLRYSFTGKQYFQYQYTSAGTGNNATFTIRARARVDCDGKLSVFTLTGRVDPITGEVRRSGVRHTKETPAAPKPATPGTPPASKPATPTAAPLYTPITQPTTRPK